ncbi:hypothetical protein RUM43_009035 [Polyplax serrata]|uniref:C2H2-type domain-containing protein n=1 Tax=Polyplax serrata TaxID=468196 RepID=A0AAN8PHJ5_POLSC
MGLNPRGRGRGRGGKGNFQNKGRRGGGMGGQGPMFRAGPPGMFCPPPMGFPPEPPFGGPFFPGPSGFNFGPPRPGFGKFPRKNFKKRVPPKNNEQPVPEIDLTKPWVTEEIKSEDAKKQELLEVWRKTKDDGDWSNYKSQKQVVKTLYDKAKDEYLATHQEEAAYWKSIEMVTAKKYYCETCDKSFKSDDALLLHEAEHETCGREGCEFTAHPKIIAKHVKMQHDTGLFKRIGKLYTDEEIAKWIEERKKKYPSRKVIEEKKAMEQEKQNRGEKIKEDNSKFNKSFQNKMSGKKSSKKVDNIPKRNRRLKKKKHKTTPSRDTNELDLDRRSIPMFCGIGNDGEQKPEENNVNDLEISDEEWDSHMSELPEKPLINSSLGLLASAYDSDERTVEGDVCEKKKSKSISDDENSSPEEVKTISVKRLPLEQNTEQIEVVKTKRPNNKKDLRQNKRLKTSLMNNNECNSSRELTLLEKLLKNEIRHERNVILQCVHYVVKNNYFGVA